MKLTKSQIEKAHIALNIEKKPEDRFSGYYLCAGCHKIFGDEIGMCETTCPNCGAHATVFTPSEDEINFKEN